MRRENFWTLLFAGAVAVLLLGILLARHVTPPVWVLVIYPAIGAGLALLVHRTSPNRVQIARLETITIAAACALVIGLSVGGAAEWLFLGGIRAAAGDSGTSLGILVTTAVATGSLALWWIIGR